MGKVAVLGAGSWGSALALVLGDNHHDVRLWTHRAEQAKAINETRQNEKYLKEITLPDEVKAYDNLNEAIADAETIVLVVPTKAIRDVCGQLKNHLDHKVTLIHAAKGIEPHTLKRVSEMIEEEVPRELYGEVVVLSGPSHAEEVGARHPTTVTVSSHDHDLAQKAQDLFINDKFRVYTNPDIVGVELGGALKNIIALGAGISDGLDYGDNAKAALITRGLAEIARLGASMGANPLTFAGLTGVGDLIVTCTSSHSRNWRAGYLLGQGRKLDDVLEEMGMVVEGVRTTQAAYQLSEQENIEMPITKGLYNLLFNQEPPKVIVDRLMNRGKTHEVEELPDDLRNQTL
ncbi:NAD(P)H-dependent glycerol-3-phosphate dehydrogenase [Salinibacillus aidingensis]|uniref:Glycerol-3-phosphate dehydrogenase [NAD(P)+] n=1 Tax=Salinibacillus aidingensis TaxID=237684 RepID=A0ABP3KJP7_9BACI